MFNLYYLNYTKAFEIAMQIDNKLLEKQIREKNKGKELGAEVTIDTKDGLLGKIVPKLSGNVNGSISRADRTEDTLRVVSTNSTILEPVIQKSVEVRKLGEDRIGKLLKIKDVSLKVANYQEMVGSKVLLSGILKNVPIDGIGPTDLTEFVNIFLKDASYIVTGMLPEKVNSSDKKLDKLLFKIPMRANGEMENAYSVSDLEIGPVTVIGIYRGTFKYGDIKQKVDTIAGMQFSKNTDIPEETDMESDNTVEATKEKNNLKANDIVHYIDVIAIIQELC